MLNFNDLQPVVKGTYSFVGIAKEGDSLWLHLPKGFDASTISTYDQKRDLFFTLYRILRQFKAICVEKSYLDPDRLGMKTPDRDGVLRGEDGKAIATVPEEDDPLIFYGKLDWMSALLDANDELKIAALVCRLGRTEKVDYSQLHRFLHQGIFLGNGNIYIDTMTLPRAQVQFEPTDIVAMYCYLLEAVSIQLGDVVSPEVTALGERFRERYLGIEASLFNEQDYDLVLNELKDALDKIDRHTPLKDEDYYTFYEAIECFLYGRWQSADEGEIWGINNFHMVWESMCLTYLAKTVAPESLLWLDRQFVPNAVLQSIDAVPTWFDLSSTFTCNGKQLRPDAVVFDFDKTFYVPLSFKLQLNNWDDYGYRITFSLKSKSEFQTTSYISIAYKGQQEGNHTSEELKKFLPSPGGSYVSPQLPPQFLSYWDISKLSSTQDPLRELCLMKRLNHVFYVAVNQGIWSSDTLQTHILNPLDVEGRLSSNVFSSALFRGTTQDSLQKTFTGFVSDLTHIARIVFQIIDIKYNDVAYFQDEANQQAIKARSVRKQFAYEYLLQQAIEATVGKSAPLQIDSTFWVPQVSNDPTVLSDLIPYLDGYLQLTPANMNQLIHHYC